MTRREIHLKRIDDEVTKILERLAALGLVGAFVRQIDGGEEMRIICPQSFLVAPMLRQAASEMSVPENAHRC